MSNTVPRIPPGRVRHLSMLLLAVTTAGLLALVPTKTAEASTPTITLAPVGQVESLLGQTPISSLNATELVQELIHIPGLEGIPPAKLKEAVEKLVTTLAGKGAPLESLLGSEGAGILKEALDGVLGPLAGTLEELLGGNPLSKLTQILGSQRPTDLLGNLLGGAHEPRTVLQKALEGIGPSGLTSLFGSSLSGGPISTGTLGELASRLGTTAETIAADLGTTVEQLPPTVTALTAPLTNGDTLAVLEGLEGLMLGLIKGGGEDVGATGGSGGSGGGGTTPGATSVTVTTTPTSGGASTPARVTSLKAGKLRVISHKVKGSTATIVVEVPAAGKLGGAGKGMRSVSRETAKAERLTLHPTLTKARSATLERNHRHLKTSMKLTFHPVSGAASAATVPLTFS